MNIMESELQTDQLERELDELHLLFKHSTKTILTIEKLEKLEETTERGDVYDFTRACLEEDLGVPYGETFSLEGLTMGTVVFTIISRLISVIIKLVTSAKRFFTGSAKIYYETPNIHTSNDPIHVLISKVLDSDMDQDLKIQFRRKIQHDLSFTNTIKGLEEERIPSLYNLTGEMTLKYLEGNGDANEAHFHTRGNDYTITKNSIQEYNGNINADGIIWNVNSLLYYNPVILTKFKAVVVYIDWFAHNDEELKKKFSDVPALITELSGFIAHVTKEATFMSKLAQATVHVLKAYDVLDEAIGDEIHKNTIGEK